MKTTLNDPLAKPFDDAYWRERFSERIPIETEYAYQDYAPAYRLGTEGFRSRTQEGFESNEERLRNEWHFFKGASRLTWERAKTAVRDAWHRLEQAIPGDADRDGY